MKLGLLSAILDGYELADVLRIAGEAGYRCVELAAWPVGEGGRRYSGVTHLDAARLDERSVAVILRECAKNGLEISALAYYPNPLDPDENTRNAALKHLKVLIRAAVLLGVNQVNTFIGKDQDKSVEENFELFRRIWPEIIRYAEDNAVRVAIENCPMLFTRDEWPGGRNLASSPAIWEELFREIESPCFGLNYDPSHLYMQGMDYIRPLYEFRKRIFHVHIKDLKIYPEKRDRCGVFAYPLDYIAPKLPGLGDLNWSAFCSALYDIGYEGAVCVEVEDKNFEKNRETVLQAVRLARNYVSQYLQAPSPKISQAG